MKRHNRAVYLWFVLLGAAFLLSAVVSDTRLDGLLFGLAGGFLGPGLVGMWRDYDWSRPQRQEAYAARQEAERISQADERNRMIRDRARGYAFTLGIYVMSLSMLVFCILDAFEVPVGWTAVILYVLILLVLEFAAYTAAFRKLQDKY